MKIQDILPANDVFADAYQRFKESQLSNLLQEKYRVRPFFEKHRINYQIAKITSYICNLFSAATGTVFIFTFLLSLFAGIQAAIFVAGAFTTIVLILHETVKRTTAPELFKTYFQFKNINIGLALMCLVLTSVSVVFSYFGAADAVKVAISTPTLKEPILINIDKIRSEYGKLITDADTDAKSYKAVKLYKGRLSDKHAKKYSSLLDEKSALKSAMIAKINDADARNNAALAQHEIDKNNTVQAHSEYINNAGFYFGIATLISELLFLCCFLFCEYYDFKSYAQFVIIGQQKQVYTTDKQGSYTLTKQPLQMAGSVAQQQDSRITKTILHNSKRLTRSDVNSRINTYIKRMQQAEKPDVKQRNQQKMNYWKARLNEFSMNGEQIT